MKFSTAQYKIGRNSQRINPVGSIKLTRWTLPPAFIPYTIQSGKTMESVFGVIGALAIVGLLALEGAFLYFVIFKKGRHTSLNKQQYKGSKKCPVCGGTMQLIKEMPCCNNPKCVNYYP